MSTPDSPTDRGLDPNDFRLPERQKTRSRPTPPTKPRSQRQNSKFLRGPIPWDWLAKAAQQPGKALQVAVTIWFLHGFKQTRIIALSPKRLLECGVDRCSAYRGLKALEKAGLVAVERHKGRAPRVTIREVDHTTSKGA